MGKHPRTEAGSYSEYKESHAFDATEKWCHSLALTQMSFLSAVNFGCEVVVKYPIGWRASQTSPAGVAGCDLGHTPTPKPPSSAGYGGSPGQGFPACICPFPLSALPEC